MAPMVNLNANANTNANSAMLTNVLGSVQYCAAQCEHMITVLLGSHDVHARATQIQLLRDCASICATTARFLARLSGFSKIMASVCAQICEICGNECAKFPDHESQRCSQICLTCAQDCRAFSMS